jgi:tetratricopeptide (TPR) repeat protein
VELDEGRLPKPEPVRALAAMLAVPIEDIRPEHQALIDVVLAQDPANPAARVRLAVLREQAGGAAAWEEARTTYQAVRQSHPQYLPATLRLIDLLDGPLAEPAQALQLARDARTANPQSPALARRAGWLALRTGDLPWAHGLLQEAARATSDPEAQYRLAVSTYCTGQPGEAMRLLQSALSTAAADAPFREEAEQFQTLLRAASAADPSPDAQRIAEATDDTRPLFIPAQMVVAHARELAGNPAEALDTYQSLLAKRPAFPLAAREAARLLVEAMDDPDKAYPLAVKAREALPQDPETARLLGRITYEREDYPYAVRLLEQTLRANPDDTNSQYLLGLSHHHQGDAPGARQALEAALAAAPDSPLAAQAREVLATME